MANEAYRYKITFSDVIVRAAIIALTEEQFSRLSSLPADEVLSEVFEAEANRMPATGAAQIALPSWCTSSDAFHLLGVDQFNAEIKVADLDNGQTIEAQVMRNGDYLEGKIRSQFSSDSTGKFGRFHLAISDASSGKLEYELEIPDEFDRDYIDYEFCQLSFSNDCLGNVRYERELLHCPQMVCDLTSRSFALYSDSALQLTKTKFA